ncbi:Temptin [Trichoplax sp. H2]|nr:Temptin [Trichoplax sp. H2]|eukprot:RDD37774.1 Temptin [Trichoplax sp. H2]
MNLWLIIKCLCVFQVVCINGYSDFTEKIPNGVKVPNPCHEDISNPWLGVGHQSSGGADARNSFGVDFANAGYTWTKSLCQMDSDGDGKTNGEELGDPECTWAVGATPSISTGLSHPGICEPLNSPTCCGQKQSWLSCNIDCPNKAENKPSNTEL